MMRVKMQEMIWMVVLILQIWQIINKMMMILKISQILVRVLITKKRICRTKLFNHQLAEKNG